jgi:hypothetical protein
VSSRPRAEKRCAEAAASLCVAVRRGHSFRSGPARGRCWIAQPAAADSHSAPEACRELQRRRRRRPNAGVVRGSHRANHEVPSTIARCAATGTCRSASSSARAVVVACSPAPGRIPPPCSSRSHPVTRGARQIDALPARCSFSYCAQGSSPRRRLGSRAGGWAAEQASVGAAWQMRVRAVASLGARDNVVQRRGEPHVGLPRRVKPR